MVTHTERLKELVWLRSGVRLRGGGCRAALQRGPSGTRRSTPVVMTCPQSGGRVRPVRPVRVGAVRVARLPRGDALLQGPEHLRRGEDLAGDLAQLLVAFGGELP